MKTKIIQWFKSRTARNIPESYLKGYRRLGGTPEQINQHAGKCFSCRNAVGYLTWHCDVLRENKPCNWVPAYNKTELTKLDLFNDHWLGLPDNIESKNK